MRKGTNYGENISNLPWKLVLGIVNYLRSELGLLFRPRYTLSFIDKDRDKSFLSNPDLFLFVNILLTYLIFETPSIIGGQFIERLKSFYEPLAPSALFIGVILRYVLGIIIFLFILRVFFRTQKINTFSRKIYEPICYASAIYMPSVVIKNFLGAHILSPAFLNLLTPAFSHSKSQFSSFDVLKMIIYLIAVVILISWWGWLLYIGIRNAFKERLKRIGRIIGYSLIFYFTIQWIIIGIWTGIRSYNTTCKPYFNLVNALNIISVESPDYLKAASLFKEVADSETISYIYRYVAQISFVTYMLATEFSDIEKNRNIFKQVSGEIENGNYLNAEELLLDFLKKASHDQEDPYRSSYVILFKEIKKAQDYLQDYLNRHDQKDFVVSAYVKSFDEIKNPQNYCFTINEDNRPFTITFKFSSEAFKEMYLPVLCP